MFILFIELLVQLSIMDTPRTASGKLCKKCLSKGSPCHLHTSVASGGISQKSAKKSPSKKKRAQGFADQFEHVPLPALEQILLNLDRERLHSICISSRQAAKVCRQPRFRKLYNAKYPSLIVGDLRIKEMIERKDIKFVVFEDDAGNKIKIMKEGTRKDKFVYRLTFDSADNQTWLTLSYGDRLPLIFGIDTDTEAIDSPGEYDYDTEMGILDAAGVSNWAEYGELMIKKFLIQVGKEEWFESFEYDREAPYIRNKPASFKLFKHVEDFYRILKTNIEKADGGKEAWSKIIDRPPNKSDYR